MIKKQIISSLKKAKVFYNLSEEQIDLIVSTSTEKNYETGEYVFRAGDPSKELIILISGQLEINVNNDYLATIDEKGITGEIGIFTDQPRSANVVAVKKSKAISVSRDDLMKIVNQNKDMGLQIYQNIITILGEHLKSNNVMVEFEHMLD